MSSFWQSVKNAFIPWRLLERDGDDGGAGMRTIEFGQTMIDGTAGDGITDVAAAVHHHTHDVQPTQPSPGKSAATS
ncbi:hypothetical protein [Rhodopseudomonas palustris]|uniref:Uncharacterized protein n=1 Tax=Rhodopseudomonas palustris (strain ATCC BAA-98 / CGA009) TaxID=258594 RepID=Q6N674_RHOPA|nr:hypothetical protein [Rhodopseudomonas palustris]ACF01589.1 hypothetical protein Rpal_3083 [Rhodopseudomonas palustris TIE-1]OPF90026.1 hypothetical protein B1S06_21675 [Rhodopseudomonas palustris]PPQ45543.1 hypothetical protein CKO39_02300 [Rhodopseudomonas palustris]QLH71783.1 hypothetical protein HZF03_13685 [Rhodopseudomonas palustris]QQM04273.1 hypothetical protein I8G32_02827 [Rhodopseudomonas palustris]